MQPVATQPLVTVTKPHGAHGDGVKHRLRTLRRSWSWYSFALREIRLDYLRNWRQFEEVRRDIFEAFDAAHLAAGR